MPNPTLHHLFLFSMIHDFITIRTTVASQQLSSRRISHRRLPSRVEWAISNWFIHWITFGSHFFHEKGFVAVDSPIVSHFSFLSLFCFQRPEHFVMGINRVAITCDCRQLRISVIIALVVARRALCIRFTRCWFRDRLAGNREKCMWIKYAG